MAHGDASLRAEFHRAGLRVTELRRAVQEWSADHPRSTAEQIGAGPRERPDPVSSRAICSALVACERAGGVRWIEPAGHSDRYEHRSEDDHHLGCRGWGRIDDVDRVVDRSPRLEPAGGRRVRPRGGGGPVPGPLPPVRGGAGVLIAVPRTRRPRAWRTTGPIHPPRPTPGSRSPATSTR